jgi:hypothetical protein
MSVLIELKTSLQNLEKLHQLAEQQAKTVKIDPNILRLLLLDHSNMYAVIKGNSNFKVKEPRHREKI